MIRPALPDEADDVRALVREACECWIPRLGREPSPMRDDYAQRIAHGEAWVLERETKLIGLVVLKDEADALLIPNIAVVPAAQGKGYGRQLIAFAEAEARRRGYGEVRLRAWSRMSPCSSTPDSPRSGMSNEKGTVGSISPWRSQFHNDLALLAFRRAALTGFSSPTREPHPERCVDDGATLQERPAP